MRARVRGAAARRPRRPRHRRHGPGHLPRRLRPQPARPTARRSACHAASVIYADDDQIAIVKRALEELSVDTRYHPARRVLSAISRAKNEGLSAATVSAHAGDYRQEVVARCFERYQEALRRERRGRFRRPAGPHAGAVHDAAARRRALPGALRARPGRRVPGHEHRAVPAGPRLGGRPWQPDRGGRPRPVDLFLARRRHPQHPALRPRLPRRHDRAPGAELPLDQGHLPRRRRRHRQGRRAHPQGALDRQRRGRPPRRLRGLHRGRGGRRGGPRDRGPRRRRRLAPAATSPSATAPTPSRASSRRPSCAAASPTG